MCQTLLSKATYKFNFIHTRSKLGWPRTLQYVDQRRRLNCHWNQWQVSGQLVIDSNGKQESQKNRESRGVTILQTHGWVQTSIFEPWFVTMLGFIKSPTTVWNTKLCWALCTVKTQVTYALCCPWTTLTHWSWQTARFPWYVEFAGVKEMLLIWKMWNASGSRMVGVVVEDCPQSCVTVQKEGTMSICHILAWV